MGRKKIIKKIKIQHFLVGTFFSVLLVLVISLYFAPFFLDWGIRYLSKKADPDLFNIYVDKLNPWEMKLEDLVFQKKGIEVSIDSLGLQYNPDDLAFGKLDAFYGSKDLTLRSTEIFYSINCYPNNQLSQNKTIINGSN